MEITSDMFDNMTSIANSEGVSDRITKYWPPKVAERKEGEIIGGKYIGSVTFGEGNDQTTYYKLKNGNEVYGVRESAVIARAFAGINQGEVVAVRYNGTKRNKAGREYNDFDVRIAPAANEAPQAAVPVEEKAEPIDLSSIPF